MGLGIYKRIQRASLAAVAIVMATVTLLALPVAPVSAASGTATWTGAAGDHKFSTAGNWAGNTLPVAGNTLVFNTAPAGGGDEEIDNDISAVFGGLTMAGPGAFYKFLLTKDLQLEAGAIVRGAFYKVIVGFAGQSGIVGAGNLTVQGTSDLLFPRVKSLAGILTINDTSYYGNIPAGATGLVLENDAMWGCIPSNTTISVPVTLGGGGAGAFIQAGSCMGSPGVDPADVYTFSSITLRANAYVNVLTNDIVKVNSLTANGFTLTRAGESDGTLITPEGTQETPHPVKTTQLDDNNPSSYIVVKPNETAYLNGSQGHILVRKNGTLKGNGTTSTLWVYDKGTVAPGNSAGKITVTDELVLNGTYQAEIMNKGSHDQIVANKVSIGGSLELVLLPGSSVARGDTFTIINNTGSSLVNGTFNGLAQGSHFTVNGVTYSINYEGGDGNDVVLTVINITSALGVPNTGVVTRTLTNPAVIALLGLGAAAVILYIRKKAHQ